MRNMIIKTQCQKSGRTALMRMKSFALEFQNTVLNGLKKILTVQK